MTFQKSVLIRTFVKESALRTKQEEIIHVLHSLHNTQAARVDAKKMWLGGADKGFPQCRRGKGLSLCGFNPWYMYIKLPKFRVVKFTRRGGGPPINASLDMEIIKNPG